MASYIVTIIVAELKLGSHKRALSDDKLRQWEQYLASCSRHSPPVAGLGRETEGAGAADADAEGLEVSLGGVCKKCEGM